MKWLLLLLLAGCGPVTTGEQRVDSTLVEVHAAQEWYKARTEPERDWRGLLRRLEAGEGPASRSALRFALETRDGRVDVYAPGESARILDPWVGRSISAHGKLIDLSSEGYGRELWIGWFRPDPAGGKR